MKSTLGIKSSQTIEVLSVYQEYIKKTGHTTQPLDLSINKIDDFLDAYVTKGFVSERSGRVNNRIKKLCGLDVLKSMIRKDLRLIDDVNHLGENEKEFLKKLKYAGLDKNTKKITQELEKMGTNFWNIFFNPSEFFPKNAKLLISETGKTKKAVNETMETFVHEYFHFAHEKKAPALYSPNSGMQTLFEYFMDKSGNKKIHKILENHYYSNVSLDSNIYFNIFKRNVSPCTPKDLAELIDDVKKNADEIFETVADKKMVIQAIKNAYEKVKFVEDNLGPYACKTVLETVAEGGKEIYKGKTINDELWEILNDLQFPK